MIKKPTVSNNQIFYDGVPLTFDATNKATLANIKDVLDISVVQRSPPDMLISNPM